MDRDRGILNPRKVRLLLAPVLVVLGLLASDASAGTIGNAYFHHGFHQDGSSAENAMGDMLAGQLGADTIRIHAYWDLYQTGPAEYNNGYLGGIVSRVVNARNSSGNQSLKVLVNFDLPLSEVGWMQKAGYSLLTTKSTYENPEHPGIRRYYPSSGAGEEAYGHAMAKALKYLHDAGVSDFIETPNEPNLTHGPSDAVPAAWLGQMAGDAVSWAAVENLQMNNNSGPAILIGSVSAGQQGTEFYGFSTAAEYFGTLQWWTDYTIEQWWANVPNGPSYAVTLMGTWRPSFHAYPKNGGNEETPCQRLPSGDLQDQRGDKTGKDAYSTVQNAVIPMLNLITRSKKWWITETGMTSYKTSFAGAETWADCVKRRENGGNTYGKTQQAEFYGEFVYLQNWQFLHSGYPWNRFEGAIFFLPQDVNISGRQFAGYGVHWPGAAPNCGLPYPCRKPAAYKFEQYY